MRLKRKENAKLEAPLIICIHIPLANPTTVPAQQYSKKQEEGFVENSPGDFAFNFFLRLNWFKNRSPDGSRRGPGTPQRARRDQEGPGGILEGVSEPSWVRCPSWDPLGALPGALLEPE